jgi:hypothetical protein
MSQNNGKDRNVAVIDLEDESAPNRTTTSFLDPDNPELKPATSIEAKKKRNWKRRLIGWSFFFLLVLGSAVAFYLLLKVNHVNVKVDADSRRDLQNTKAVNGNNPENGQTEEAINIARNASGIDAGTEKQIPGASPNPSPTPTPSLQTNTGWNYRFKENSPVYDQINDANSGNGNQQQNNGDNQQQSRSGAGITEVAMQNHANATQSIFVEDQLPKISATPRPTSGQVETRSENRPTLVSKPQPIPAVLPPFGTMLPVRTQGVIFTLRNNSYVRLELTRDVSGTGWSLPKGTILVGRTIGSDYDRAFVNVLGYIDPRDNKLVKMTGDILGVDGAAGVPGKRIGTDSNRLRQALRKVASSGLQAASLLGGALSRGTVILDRSGYSLPYDIRGTSSDQNQKREFVKVPAGQAAYVMVADLPKSIQAIDAPGDDELLRAANSLSDREVMELILFGSPDEIRAALPFMTEEQKRLTTKSLMQDAKEK